MNFKFERSRLSFVEIFFREALLLLVFADEVVIELVRWLRSDRLVFL